MNFALENPSSFAMQTQNDEEQESLLTKNKKRLPSRSSMESTEQNQASPEGRYSISYDVSQKEEDKNTENLSSRYVSGVVLSMNPQETDTASIIHKALTETLSQIDTQGNLVKLEIIDPLHFKTIMMRYPKLKENEPKAVFLILPQSLKIETEERPKEAKPEKKKASQADILRKKLDNILRSSNKEKIEESTALVSFKKYPNYQDAEDNQPTWDNINKFVEELDNAFFSDPRSARSVLAAKSVVGVLGLTPLWGISGAILDAVDYVFDSGSPAELAGKTALTWWIRSTTAPVSIRQLYKRAGKILEKDSFLTLSEDESLTTKRTNEAKKKIVEEKLQKKKETEGSDAKLSSQEIHEATAQAQNEVGEPYRSRPHVFKKSKRHKAALAILATSSVTNALIPALAVLDMFAWLSGKTGVPYDYLFGVPVIIYYAENYYDFGTERLWDLFSYYSYIGSGQTSEEDSREKRRILTERIKQFQHVIAASKYDAYVNEVYDAIHDTIHKKKKNLNTQSSENPSEEEVISAFSLLMMRSKIRLDEQDGYGMKAVNFKNDLDVIKVNWKEDFLDNLTAGIVGAGFFADTEIVRYALQQIFQDLFNLDEITAAEMSCFYATGFLDTSFRAGIEFNLHQRNLKSWLKTFS